MEIEVAARYTLPDEYDRNDLGSYLRYMYGLMSSMGMSYDEYWNNTDELLVESYLKRNDFKINSETYSNWEHINMMREALHEVASAVHTPKGEEKYKFPKKPHPRTFRGQLEQERIDKINADLTHITMMQQRERETEK